MSDETNTRETYMEVTLHLRGGGNIAFAAKEITTKRNTLAGGYTNLEWTHNANHGLPRLHSVELSEVVAITTRDAAEDE